LKWDLSHTAMFNDHNQLKKEEDASMDINKEIEMLDEDAYAKAFESDTLKINLDTATLLRLCSAEQKDGKSRRTAKVLHLKGQNVIGSQIVKEFMEAQCDHIAGPLNLVATAMSQATWLNEVCEVFETSL